jgi:hypothetical protein
MRPLTKKADAVLGKLTQGLDKLGAHKKIDNSEGTFMAVYIELIEETNWGPLFSIAHYYEQNGDLMRDPEMVFLRARDLRYYPTYFRQDGGLGFEQNSVTIESGAVKSFIPAIQDEHRKFANLWMQNIKEQQEL